MIARLVLSLGFSLLFSLGMALVALADVAGDLTIAGNGPELTTIEPLARAFEKANPRAYLDVVWDGNSKPVEMVKAGQAHIAVTGTEAPDLSATPIAWDGIGVPVRLLPTHMVEPEIPTVKDGRYPFRRPVLLLSKKEPHPLAEAFTQFVLSQAGQQLIAETYIPIKET